MLAGSIMTESNRGRMNLGLMTGLSRTWQWFSLNEYNDKFMRDSGMPSTLPEPPPPPTPKARPQEKGQGKSEPSGSSSSRREDGQDNSSRNQNQGRWNN
eukprot:5755269-Pyramimonas_sp.AAC.1